MTDSDARQIIGWQYEPPYSVYNLNVNDIDAEAAAMADTANNFFTMEQNGEVVGGASYGADGQVPGGDYSEDALDIGAGVRPDLTGRGNGAAIVAEILAFGRAQFAPRAFRVTIAGWNVRAQRVWLKNGFTERSRFIAPHNEQPYIIFVRAADAALY
jgi:RimJ/RimL family protein N-acetyltransferase